MNARSQLAVIAALLLLAVASASIARAQDSPAPQPSATALPRKVRISFLPPPLKGSISLGIYDAKGKLVRVLHRESDIDEFQIGHDALSTTWDGNDDANQPLPAAKYHARGYVVGDLQIEGVGFYFNDWITDDRPERIEKICAIKAEGDGAIISAKVAHGGNLTLICDSTGSVTPTQKEDAPADCGSVNATIATGKDHTRWTIEPATDDKARMEVKQYSATNELLRRLTLPADQPQPRGVAASPDAERIFLLEENATVQRLRGLSLLATKSGGEQSISDWKVDFEKAITAHSDFRLEAGKPVVTGGESPPDTLPMKLQRNPLEKDKAGTAELAVGYDADGSYLKTADGLPLQTISETQHLVRAVIAPHDPKSVDVFQDDGTVVEQFRVTNVDAMMAFDCGDFELK